MGNWPMGLRISSGKRPCNAQSATWRESREVDMNACTGMVAIDMKPPLEAADNHGDAGQPESRCALPGSEDRIERAHAISKKPVTSVGNRDSNVASGLCGRADLPVHRGSPNR